MGIEQQDWYDDEFNSSAWTGGKAKIDEIDKRLGEIHHEIAMERYNEDHDVPGEDDISTDRNIVRVLQKKYKCHDCGRYYPETCTCEAFPEVIPVVIYSDDFEHVIPYKGDDGLRWIPITSKKR